MLLLLFALGVLPCRWGRARSRSARRGFALESTQWSAYDLSATPDRAQPVNTGALSVSTSVSPASSRRGRDEPRVATDQIARPAIVGQEQRRRSKATCGSD